MGGGGSALIDLRREMTPKQTHAINEPPMLGAFGIDDARIVHPGDPARSVLLYRVAKCGSGRMPKIGSQVVDDRAVALLGRWIAEMDLGGRPPAKGRAEQDTLLASLQTTGGDNASTDTAVTRLRREFAAQQP